MQSIHLRKPSATSESHRSQSNVASVGVSSAVQKVYHGHGHQKCKSGTPSKISYAASKGHMLDSACRLGEPEWSPNEMSSAYFGFHSVSGSCSSLQNLYGIE